MTRAGGRSQKFQNGGDVIYECPLIQNFPPIFSPLCDDKEYNVVKSRCWKFAEKKLQYTTSLYRTKIVQKIVAISDYRKGEKNMNLSNSKFSKVLPI